MCLAQSLHPAPNWFLCGPSWIDQSFTCFFRCWSWKPLKILPVAAAPVLHSIMEYCRWFGLFMMSWLVLSTVWPAGQGQWPPPVLGTDEDVPQILGSVFTFIECNKATSNQNGLDFSKDEIKTFSLLQASKVKVLISVGLLHCLKYRNYQIPDTKDMVWACSALRGAQWPFKGSCLNVLCPTGNISCNCRSTLPHSSHTDLCQTVPLCNFVLFLHVQIQNKIKPVKSFSCVT